MFAENRYAKFRKSQSMGFGETPPTEEGFFSKIGTTLFSWGTKGYEHYAALKKAGVTKKIGTAAEKLIQAKQMKKEQKEIKAQTAEAEKQKQEEAIAQAEYNKYLKQKSIESSISTNKIITYGAVGGIILLAGFMFIRNRK